MNLPSLYSLQSGRSILTAFGGLNESYACGEAEFTEEMNFSSQGYPALQTRNPRRKLGALANCNGMYHLNGRLTCTGTTLTYVQDDVDGSAGTPYFELTDAVTDTAKIMVGMGTQILIWPDAKSFDTKTGKLEDLGASWAQGEGTVEVSPCDAGGKTYEVEEYGAKEPEEPKDGLLFLKVNDEATPWAYVSVLEQYDAKMEKWVEIKLDHVRLTMPGLAAAGFKKGDTMTVSGIPDKVETYLAGNVNGEMNIEQLDGDSVVVTGVPAQESKAYFGTFAITAERTKWTSLDGSEAKTFEGAAAAAQRRVPELEYVTENANRVWGCNSKENIIYSCKQGDPTNWYCYNGIASDSYAVTVGSEGGFTGAATCMGYVLFFKENTIHKIYGSRPADYQVVSTQCRGVAKGASRSLSVINETLYYLSCEGVMAWDGSLPVNVSTMLDRTSLMNARYAAGAALDARYYLYTRVPQATGTRARLLVYDTERKLWHEEDTGDGQKTAGWEMCSTRQQLYLWDGEALWAAEPDRESDRETDEAQAAVEKKVDFTATTGDIGLTGPDDKYVSRVTLRVDALAYSVVRVQASYDGGAWKTLGDAAVLNRWVRVNLPFVPARHDTLRLRISGTGQIAVRSIAFTFAASRGNRVAGA